ncbi:MAG: polypeptide-transport-associated domain protein shlb-type [Rhodobacteraceae bacterium]|nr:polypeptide-transport-associated domain protein shlb-type [Paracoccaceae bacterium]
MTHLSLPACRTPSLLSAPALAVLLVVPCGAFAQSAPVVDRALAGQTVILQRFTPPPQVGTVGLSVEDQRKRVDMAAAERITIALKSVTVDGARTVPVQDLVPIWQNRIGTTITLADLYRMAEAVDAAYLAAGYFSKTVVPVQDFATGRIRLQVYEGYVQRVEITSDIPGIEDRLKPYIDRILAMHPIRVKEAERVLLLMSDLGGLEIEGTFVRPEDATGGGLLKLDIGQDKRSGMIGLDNLGSEAVGPLELSSSVTLNDMLRRFETTNLVGVVVPDDPKELGLFQFSQDYPVGHDGLTAGFSLTYLSQHPGGSLKDQDIDVTSTIGTGYLAYPILRTLDQSLFGKAELTIRDDDVDVAGSALSRSQTRWATFSLEYDRLLETGSLSAEGGVNLGVADDIDMGDVPGDFRFISASVDYLRALGPVANLRVRAAGQFSPEPLPGAVQFALGGDPYGWAFDNGSLSGDSGAATAVEIGRDIETRLDVMPEFTLSVFADYGTVWSQSAGIDADSLGSYGVGLGAMVADRLMVQLVGALPWTTPDSLDDPGGSVLFRIAMPF